MAPTMSFYILHLKLDMPTLHRCGSNPLFSVHTKTTMLPGITGANEYTPQPFHEDDLQLTTPNQPWVSL